MADDLTATQTELHWLTIGDAARLIESRRLSPVELSDALLARIEALDPQVNAFLLPTPEKARERIVPTLKVRSLFLDFLKTIQEWVIHEQIERFRRLASEDLFQPRIGYLTRLLNLTKFLISI